MSVVVSALRDVLGKNCNADHSLVVVVVVMMMVNSLLLGSCFSPCMLFSYSFSVFVHVVVFVFVCLFFVSHSYNGKHFNKTNVGRCFFHSELLRRLDQDDTHHAESEAPGSSNSRVSPRGQGHSAVSLFRILGCLGVILTPCFMNVLSSSSVSPSFPTPTPLPLFFPCLSIVFADF